MVIVPPYEQYGGHYTVGTITSVGNAPTDFTSDYANVVVPTAAVNTVQLDGTVVLLQTSASSDPVCIPERQFKFHLAHIISLLQLRSVSRYTVTGCTTHLDIRAGWCSIRRERAPLLR